MLGNIKMTFEKVYTVWEYYDGPRTGLANYQGIPHAYFCEWSEADDDYASTYNLTPVSDETLFLALEQWEIFREWEAAFHNGEVLLETHPLLSGQNKRYSEIQVILDKTFKESRGPIKKTPIFRPKPHQSDLPKGVMRELEVEWK